MNENDGFTRRSFLKGLAAALAVSAPIVGPAIAKAATAKPLLAAKFHSVARPDLLYMWQHILEVKIDDRRYAWLTISESERITNEMKTEAQELFYQQFGVRITFE